MDKLKRSWFTWKLIPVCCRQNGMLGYTQIGDPDFYPDEKTLKYGRKTNNLIYTYHQ